MSPDGNKISSRDPSWRQQEGKGKTEAGPRLDLTGMCCGHEEGESESPSKLTRPSAREQLGSEDVIPEGSCSWKTAPPQLWQCQHCQTEGNTEGH